MAEDSKREAGWLAGRRARERLKRERSGDSPERAEQRRKEQAGRVETGFERLGGKFGRMGGGPGIP